jgi:predicted nucleotidyltransferase
MVKENTQLNKMVRRIVGKAHPERIILFGSRARGDFHPKSDFDLLIIADSMEPRYKRSAPLYALLSDFPLEVDVVVYTPKEVDEWRDVPQSFVTTACREGVVIYERQD